MWRARGVDSNDYWFGNFSIQAKHSTALWIIRTCNLCRLTKFAEANSSLHRFSAIWGKISHVRTDVLQWSQIFLKCCPLWNSLCPQPEPTEPYQFLASSGFHWKWCGGGGEVEREGEKAATHLTNHPNSFKHKFRTKISHKSDTKRTTVTVLPPRFKSDLELAFDQTTATY